MTQHWTKIYMKFDSAAESVLPQGMSLPSFLQNLDCISGLPCDFVPFLPDQAGE